MNYNTIKNQLLQKWNFVDETMLKNAIKEAENNLLSEQDVMVAIDDVKISNAKPLTSSLLSNVVINEIFYKNHPDYFYESGIKQGAYKTLPKLDLIVQDLLKNKNALFKKMFISQFGLYNFANLNFDGDISLKNKLDFEVLKTLQKDQKINLKDLQLNLYNKDNVLVKNLLLNDDKLIIQSNAISVNEKNSATNYFYTYNLLNGLLTKALCNDPNSIKGFSLINNNANQDFAVFDFDLNLSSPKYQVPNKWKGRISIPNYLQNSNDTNYTSYITSPEFSKDIQNLYHEYATWLTKNYDYKPEILKDVKDDIQTRLVKENEFLINSKVQTNIKDFKPFDYYKASDNSQGQELSEEEKQFKFVALNSPSPSQINSYLYNKKSITNDFVAMCETVCNKYSLTLTDEQRKVIKDIVDGKEIDSSLLNTQLERKEFSANSLTRMNFGNQCEEIILNHYASLHPEQNIKVDKATLTSSDFDVNFDIDGYIGNDLNHISQVIEIKNSASSYYFDDPNRIADAYWMQMTYYNELLKPKQGVKMIAAISTGKTTKLYENDFKPTQEQIDTLYQALEDFKKAQYFLVKYNLFDFNNLVNEIKQEKYFKATGMKKTFDIKKELLGKQNKR